MCHHLFHNFSLGFRVSISNSQVSLFFLFLKLPGAWHSVENWHRLTVATLSRPTYETPVVASCHGAHVRRSGQPGHQWWQLFMCTICFMAFCYLRRSPGRPFKTFVSHFPRGASVARIFCGHSVWPHFWLKRGRGWLQDLPHYMVQGANQSQGASSIIVQAVSISVRAYVVVVVCDWII